MLKHKHAGMPTPKDKPTPPPQNVVNLMDALRRSIAQDNKAPKPKKRATAQSEMLLPIAGSGRKAKAAAGPATKQQRKAS